MHHAELVLDEGGDPRPPGGAVTTALCGHGRHEGACQWPRNSEIDTAKTPTLFRTLFVATPAEEAEVRKRIDAGLATARGWSVKSSGARPILRSERALGQPLLSDVVLDHGAAVESSAVVHERVGQQLIARCARASVRCRRRLRGARR